MSAVTYYLDEAGDGVLFGPKGRDRFLYALWPKVSIIHDVDDPESGRAYPFFGVMVRRPIHQK
jgi:hypothetical protein